MPCSAPSSRGLGRRPLKAVTPVLIRSGLLFSSPGEQRFFVSSALLGLLLSVSMFRLPAGRGTGRAGGSRDRDRRVHSQVRPSRAQARRGPACASRPPRPASRRPPPPTVRPSAGAWTEEVALRTCSPPPSPPPGPLEDVQGVLRPGTAAPTARPARSRSCSMTRPGRCAAIQPAAAAIPAPTSPPRSSVCWVISAKYRSESVSPEHQARYPPSSSSSRDSSPNPPLCAMIRPCMVNGWVFCSVRPPVLAIPHVRHELR